MTASVSALRGRRGRRVVRGTLSAQLLPTGPAESGVGPLALEVRLRWSAEDPLLVAAVFGAHRDAVCWALSRELLVAGCDAPAGHGDVALLPDPTRAGAAELVLMTPDGHACLRIDLAELQAFLGRTHGRVAELSDRDLQELLELWTGEQW